MVICKNFNGDIFLSLKEGKGLNERGKYEEVVNAFQFFFRKGSFFAGNTASDLEFFVNYWVKIATETDVAIEDIGKPWEKRKFPK